LRGKKKNLHLGFLADLDCPSATATEVDEGSADIATKLTVTKKDTSIQGNEIENNMQSGDIFNVDFSF